MKRGNITLVLIIIFVSTTIVIAQKEERIEEIEGEKTNIIKTMTKEITGEVSGVSNDFIAIIYQRDKEKNVEYEMGFFVEEGVKLEKINNLADLKIGTIVTITYEELTELDEEGKELIRRRAKAIKFVKPAPKEVPPQPWEIESE